ncbi:MAG: hypothetical protein M1831_001808 [Alyxoria varia]|nr:MAG: hypothetical protein M1831_001808 [Alyxoria varia]
MADLEPPRKSVELEDSGVHELASEASTDDAFEDASEQKKDRESPSIPTTRVEKTDDEPSHGEVPGTAAYKLRTQDAVPDELEVVPEGSRSRSSSAASSEKPRSSSMGVPVPKTVVEKVDPTEPSHGEVPGTVAYAIRRADAEPDTVMKASDSESASEKGSPTSPSRFKTESETQMSSHGDSQLAAQGISAPYGDLSPTRGDDFDDFEEGEEADDFGAFGEGAEADEIRPENVDKHTPSSMTLSSKELVDLDNAHSLDDVLGASQTLISDLFPLARSSTSGTGQDISLSKAPSFTERSQSLWSQLVAPPPLQPPNWVKSRIRRLFFVSLGVPVNLDEILPASKQKKLVLPSIDVEREASQHQTGDSSANGSAAKLKQKDGSSVPTSSSSSGKADHRRKGQSAAPDFDANLARLLCSRTMEALTNLTDEELQEHTSQLAALKTRASEALQYWLVQRDSANGDKEAFEEVIDNLVKHAKKIRK